MILHYLLLIGINLLRDNLLVDTAGGIKEVPAMAALWLLVTGFSCTSVTLSSRPHCIDTLVHPVLYTLVWSAVRMRGKTWTASMTSGVWHTPA